MKNLHLEATEEKTLLVLRLVDNKLVLHTPITRWHGVNQYVHITSDEEVKPLDWTLHYYDGKPVVSKASQKVIDGDYKREDYKKIILTTHPLLIADGVQAIDGDFLKWLIKNPNCNFVEVKKEMYMPFDGKVAFELALDETLNTRTYYSIVDLKQVAMPLDNLVERFKRDMSMVVMPLDNENIPEEEEEYYLQGFIDQFGTGVLGELDPNEWDALQFLGWLKLNDYEIIKKK